MKRLVIILIIAVIVPHISFMCGSAEAQRGRAGKKPSKMKNPMTAALLSLAPGGGQFYNGDIPKGIVFAGGGLLSLLAMFHTGTKQVPDTTIFPPPVESYHDMVWLGVFGLFTVWGGGAADAYFTAIRKNKELYKVKAGWYINKFEVKLSYYF